MLKFFLDLFKTRYEHERDWLKDLRDASGVWYNQLTEPLLPVLLGNINPNDPQAKKKYQEIADGLLKEAFVINAGDEVNNVFQEMGKRGLPFLTSRETLKPLLEEYLKGGLFLKRIAYGFDPKRASKQWREFELAKNKLISEINSQLRKLG